MSGFSEKRWATVQKIKPGDHLLCYLTRVSRWVGLLEAVGKPFFAVLNLVARLRHRNHMARERESRQAGTLSGCPPEVRCARGQERAHPLVGCDSSVPVLVEAVSGSPWLSKVTVTVCCQTDPSE